jgi:plastocyanin
MSKKALITVVIVAVVILGIIGLVWAQRDNAPAVNTSNNPIPTPSQTAPSNNSGSTSTTPSEQVATTISYTNNGFTPAQVTVKSGDTILVKNDSGNPLSFNSDDHPTHTKQPELNVGSIEPGQSKTFVVTKQGTWGYHNHDNPTDTGKITVE